MVIREFVRCLVWSFWVLVPHPFVSSGQFSSAICRRCRFQHRRMWY